MSVNSFGGGVIAAGLIVSLALKVKKLTKIFEKTSGNNTEIRYIAFNVLKAISLLTSTGSDLSLRFAFTQDATLFKGVGIYAGLLCEEIRNSSNAQDSALALASWFLEADSQNSITHSIYYGLLSKNLETQKNYTARQGSDYLFTAPLFNLFQTHDSAMLPVIDILHLTRDNISFDEFKRAFEQTNSQHLQTASGSKN